MKTMRSIASSVLGISLMFSQFGCAISAFSTPYSAEEEIRQTHAVGESPRIVVESFNGEIQVTTGSAGKVECTVVKKVNAASQDAADDDLENVQVEIKQDGDVIKVIGRQVNGRPMARRSVHVTMDVPPGTVVDLKTSNGKVSLKGPLGDSVVETSNGAIESRGGKGDQRLSTSNGAIFVEGGKDRLTLRSSNGSIKMRGKLQIVDARTSNGRIQFDGSLASGRSYFKSSNGGIVLDLPKESQFQVDARSSNGKINSDFKVDTKKGSSRKHLIGTVGDDPKVTLDVETSNGTIDIHNSGVE